MSDECREWPGSRTDKGYGRIRWGKHGYIAVHRLVWIAANGEIPEDLMILHHCDNPPCFRLDHLRVGTHEDNMSDRSLAGHYQSVPQRGEDNGQSKLTEADVRAIRELYGNGGVRQVDLAEQFGITQPQVSDIVRRKLWAHVKD